MNTPKTHRISYFEANCCSVYLVVFLFLAIKPYFFSVWLVENITVWLFVVLVLYIRIRHCRFSKISIFLITSACISHTIGGHYGFANVPLGKCLIMFGEFGRNNFDRMGHFLCGTLTYPLLELAYKKHFFSNKTMMYIFSFFAMMGIAAVYELLEWLDYSIAKKTHAELFIGSLVDAWDPHADMLNCCIGIVVAMVLSLIINPPKRQSA